MIVAEGPGIDPILARNSIPVDLQLDAWYIWAPPGPGDRIPVERKGAENHRTAAIARQSLR